MFWEEFLSRLGQGAAGGGAVSHTRYQLEAAVRAKRSTEAIELIPEVCNGHIICTLYIYTYLCMWNNHSDWLDVHTVYIKVKHYRCCHVYIKLCM